MDSHPIHPGEHLAEILNELEISESRHRRHWQSPSAVWRCAKVRLCRWRRVAVKKGAVGLINGVGVAIATSLESTSGADRSG